MAQFWKPGTEKPRLIDDEEGGVLFLSASASSSSSGCVPFSQFSVSNPPHIEYSLICASGE